MGAALTITTEGGKAIERKLLGLQDAFGDLTPLMDAIGLTLESTTLERFDREQAPDGSKWSQSVRAREEGGKTLTDSSQLRSSITSNAGPGSVEIGTNKIYAGVHQYGFNESVRIKAHDRTILSAFGIKLKAPVTFQVSSFERAMNIPARPFLGMSTEDEAEIIAQAEDYAMAAGAET